MSHQVNKFPQLYPFLNTLSGGADGEQTHIQRHNQDGHQT